MVGIIIRSHATLNTLEGGTGKTLNGGVRLMNDKHNVHTASKHAGYVGLLL